MNLSLSSSTSLWTSSTTSSSSSSSSSTSWFSGIVRGRSASTKMSSNSSATASFGDSLSPIVKKNHWRGVLFKYGPKPIQVAFKTGDYKQQVIFIGGLTDVFLAIEVTTFPFCINTQTSPL
nr:putative uncharacterized protein DDB_G0277255 [Quercus suber]